MPYGIVKRMKKKHAVAKVVTKTTGKAHSKKWLPVARAKAQLRAIKANTPEEE